MRQELIKGREVIRGDGGTYLIMGVSRRIFPLSPPFVIWESVVEYFLSRPLCKGGADEANTLSFAPPDKGELT